MLYLNGLSNVGMLGPVAGVFRQLCTGANGTRCIGKASRLCMGGIYSTACSYRAVQAHSAWFRVTAMHTASASAAVVQFRVAAASCSPIALASLCTPPHCIL